MRIKAASPWRREQPSLAESLARKGGMERRPSQPMASNRPSSLIIAAQIVGLAVVCAVAVLTAGTADWDLPLFGIQIGRAHV